jgi:pimeloyl-ACP methyl ester carboxylesterase
VTCLDQAAFPIAAGLKVLMVDVLGFPTFAAHGHDWGAVVATRLAYAHADRLQGMYMRPAFSTSWSNSVASASLRNE